MHADYIKVWSEIKQCTDYEFITLDDYVKDAYINYKWLQCRFYNKFKVDFYETELRGYEDIKLSDYCIMLAKLINSREKVSVQKNFREGTYNYQTIEEEDTSNNIRNQKSTCPYCGSENISKTTLGYIEEYGGTIAYKTIEGIIKGYMGYNGKMGVPRKNIQDGMIKQYACKNCGRTFHK